MKKSKEQASGMGKSKSGAVRETDYIFPSTAATILIRTRTA